MLLILIVFIMFILGPEKWPELFPMASGHRQSPVNITSGKTQRGSTIHDPISWKYVPDNIKSLVNPGEFHIP